MSKKNTEEVVLYKPVVSAGMGMGMGMRHKDGKAYPFRVVQQFGSPQVKKR